MKSKIQEKCKGCFQCLIHKNENYCVTYGDDDFYLRHHKRCVCHLCIVKSMCTHICKDFSTQFDDYIYARPSKRVIDNVYHKR